MNATAQTTRDANSLAREAFEHGKDTEEETEDTEVGDPEG